MRQRGHLSQKAELFWKTPEGISGSCRVNGMRTT